MKPNKKPRAVCAILAAIIVIVLTILCGTSTVFAEVIATEPQFDNDANAYQISSAEELLWFAQEVNNNANLQINAVLTQDIDLSNIDNWTPIGNTTTKYEGVFDGKGHTIKNMKIKAVANKLGLFGRLHNGTIKNLTVSGTINCIANNISKNDCDYNYDVGGIAGKITNDSLISNVVSEVNISDVYNAYEQHIGGIVGDCCNSTIENCTNKGTLNIRSTLCVGGITGYVGQYYGNTIPVSIIGCTNAGDVTTIVSGARTAGIAALVSSSLVALEMSNCVNTGTISAVNEAYSGALIGYRKIDTSTNSICSTSASDNYWTSETCANAIGSDNSKSKLTNIGYTTYAVTGGKIRLDYTTSIYEVTAVELDEGITNADIPSAIGNTNVTKITNGFKNLTNLVSVSIPKNASIEATAFDGCTNLKNVYLYKGSKADNFFSDSTVTKTYVLDQADGIYIDKTKTDYYDFSVVVDTNKFGGATSTGAQFLNSVGIILDGTSAYSLDSFVYSSDGQYVIFRCKFTDDDTDISTVRGKLVVGGENTETYVSDFAKL